MDGAGGVERWFDNPPAYPGGTGRGVVIPAGGNYLPGAWVIIGLLRRLGCNLPVEIWHQGPGELTWIAEAIARRFSGVMFRDVGGCLGGHLRGAQDKGGWQLKAEALEGSCFREVLLLDADNEPLLDPDELFLDEGYAATGTLFWHEPIGGIGETNGAWRRLGMSPREHAGLDSAQLLVDRELAWRGVSLAAWLNRNYTIYWRDLYGDKDTFLLAWLRSSCAFSTIDRRPPVVGRSIRHGDRAGRPCFRHRFDEKWSIREAPPASDRSGAAELIRELRGIASMNGNWR